jgi:hypothetical protein
MSHVLLNALRRTAGGLAILAAFTASPASSAQAGEVITTDCLHGSGNRYDSASRSEYGGAYSNDNGDQYGSRYSYTRPNGGGLRRGFGGRFHREFVTGARDANGGGSINGVNAGSNNGYHDGYANEYGAGSRNDYGSSNCVEVRHELINPFVINVPQPEKDAGDIEARDRLWRARCRPTIREDAYGVRRYQYAAAGCEYGKYE